MYIINGLTVAIPSSPTVLLYNGQCSNSAIACAVSILPTPGGPCKRKLLQTVCPTAISFLLYSCQAYTSTTSTSSTDESLLTVGNQADKTFLSFVHHKFMKAGVLIKPDLCCQNNDTNHVLRTTGDREQ